MDCLVTAAGRASALALCMTMSVLLVLAHAPCVHKGASRNRVMFLLTRHRGSIPTCSMLPLTGTALPPPPAPADMLQRYFSAKLAQLSAAYDSAAAGGSEEAPGQAGQGEEDSEDMQTDENTNPHSSGQPGGSGAAAGAAVSPSALLGSTWVARLEGICGALRSLGLQAAAEEAYTAVVHSHVSSR